MDKPHPKIEPSLFYYYNIPLRKKVREEKRIEITAAIHPDSSTVSGR
jgi:hypothetical protein